MAYPIYTSAGSASAPSNTQAAYGRRVMANTASRNIRNRIRPKTRAREDDYRDFVKSLLGRPDVDVRDIESIHKAARRFAGFEEEETLTDPYARRQQRVAGEYTAAGRLGRAKMARLRAARLEETAPRRQAVKEQRARRLAGQQARDAQYAREKAERERQGVPGAMGTITTPEGVAIPEELYERRQVERRRPLAAREPAKLLPEEIAEKEERIRQIRAERQRAPVEEGGRRTLRGDVAVPAEQARLEADIERLRTAPARTTGARRPGETPTIRAHEYMTQTYPLMQKQERLEAQANRLGNAYMRATDPEQKARALAAWRRAERQSQTMAERARAGPQAPGAVELGEEQARFQREAAAQAPARRAMEKRMVGASRTAVEATRARQEAERGRREATAAEARGEPGITLKPETVSAAAKLSREKWEHEKRTKLEKPIQARLDSLEDKINPKVDPMFGPLELTDEQKVQREKDLKDYERILRKLEAARKISPGTADMLVEEMVLTDEEQAELEKREKASGNTPAKT